MAAPPSPADGPSVRIVARDVERHFGSGDGAVHALGPLDLEIHDGEFVCIVGPSGCGKSTFLMLVAGLMKPSAGLVGRRASAPGRSPIAMVFQDYGIFPWKTVEANVRFGLQVTGVKRAPAREKARYWLDRLGLLDFADKYPSQLSGGMRQRVSIARALAVEPEILLMDEPFAALDAQLRLILQEDLLRLWEEDRRTVLFVTHSLEEAILLGDRIVVMSARPGRVLESEVVPFERPRDASIRDSAEFNELRGRLWAHLRGEIEHREQT